MLCRDYDGQGWPKAAGNGDRVRLGFATVCLNTVLLRQPFESNIASKLQDCSSRGYSGMPSRLHWLVSCNEVHAWSLNKPQLETWCHRFRLCRFLKFVLI